MNKIENIKYEIDENGCWICKNYIDRKGYGNIKVKQKNTRAHRRVYEIINGKIPNNLIVRHTCDIRSCVNPDHLILGTIQDNNKDTIDRNRTCKGEKHYSTKLKEKDIIDIRNNNILTQKELSIIYNVSRSTIGAIKTNKSWKHL